MKQAYRNAACAADAEIWAAAERFSAAESMVDHAVRQLEDKHPEMTRELHQQWTEAAMKAASLPASTLKGVRAKATILLAVLAVLAPSTGERDLHEILAESVARDLVQILEG